MTIFTSETLPPFIPLLHLPPLYVLPFSVLSLLCAYLLCGLALIVTGPPNLPILVLAAVLVAMLFIVSTQACHKCRMSQK